MNSEIYLKASELARVISESPEALRFREAEQNIMHDKVARNLAERWHKVYSRVSEVMNKGEELSEKDARSVEFIEAKVENHPMMMEYVEAHKEFGALLADVDGVLSAAFNFTLAEASEEDACAGCPSKGNCQVNPDECSGSQA